MVKQLLCQFLPKQNLGIDDLLETIILLAEMEKDKIVANPKSEAVGTIIESHIDKGEGPVATVLVQNGTLNLGDNLCINDDFFGKARALKDYNSQGYKRGRSFCAGKNYWFKIFTQSR